MGDGPGLQVLFLLVLLVGAAGCGETGEEAVHRGEARTNPFLGDGRVAELQLSEELELDLTGDGIPEEVLVTVHGADPRMLEIEFAVFGRGGQVLYGSVWSSAGYPEFQRAGSEAVPAWVASQAVRERFQDLLGDDSIHPLSGDEIDPEVVRWELQLEEWRNQRGLPASSPLTPEEEAEAAQVQVPEERVAEVLASLPGRPAFRYLAGDSYRTVVWSSELGRFLTVDACC